MEPFKNMFNPISLEKLAIEIKASYPAFNKSQFKKTVLKDLEKLELKERVILIAQTFRKFLPDNYKKSVQILLDSLAEENKKEEIEWNQTEGKGIIGFLTWPFNQYIELYGLDDYETSFHAMIELTKRFSSEFTIRPFLSRYENKIFKDLEKLIKHPNHHVRRWVSEGIRPNLPWGQSVPLIIKNLNRNISFLEILYKDESEYVRRSVANHLNDISRIDPQLMLQTCKKLKKNNNSKNTQWVIRHATRTLLKQGNKEALVLNGYTKNPQTNSTKPKLSTKTIHEGDRFELQFNLNSKSKKNQKILIEYIIYYPKKNGLLSPKVFRLKDFTLKPLETIQLIKTIHFKKVTTRVHYKGKHIIEIQINGEKSGKTFFNLV